MQYSNHIVKEIQDYCLNKPGAYETRPFGEFPICYRIMGKIFVQFMPQESFFKITLKTHPEQAIIYRELFPQIVTRGYHCPPIQQPHWNTIDLNLFHDIRLLYQMIDEAYEEIVSSLTKRKRFQLAEISCFDFFYKETIDKDFRCLAMLLDETLEKVVAGKIDRSEYKPYNQLEEIHDIIIVYCNKEPIACGSFKFYDNDHAELKRIYVTPNYQGMGLGYEIIRRLEAIAKIKGFKYCILETGELLQASCHIYKKLGYQRIDNYGPYVNMINSICMSHKI